MEQVVCVNKTELGGEGRRDLSAVHRTPSAFVVTMTTGQDESVIAQITLRFPRKPTIIPSREQRSSFINVEKVDFPGRK